MTNIGIEEIKQSILKTAQKDCHNEEVKGLEESVSFSDILADLPKDWRRKTGNNFENMFSVEIVRITQKAVNELIAENKIQRVPHITVQSERRPKVIIPIGRWEEGFALTKKISS